MNEYKRYRLYNTGFITDKIKNLVAVDKPIIAVNKIEAEQVGLVIISRSSNPNMSLYKHKECGHFEFLQPTHVRRNNIKCSTCHRLKEISEAEAVGYLLLHKTKGSCRKYIKNCGHLSELFVGNIKNTKAERCDQCFQESLQNFARKNKYRLVKNLNNGRWLIGFDTCLHQKEVHYQQIIKGNVVCRPCLVENHINNIGSTGLVYQHSTTDGYALYNLPCGHIREIRQDHAEDGSWICHVCGDSHYTKPSNVYLIKFTTPDFSWLKLGFSKHLELRAANYGVPNSVLKEILEIVPFETGYDAMKFEKQIHAKYKSIRYHKSRMKNYHLFNGFTECYPESALPILLNELITIKEIRCQK